VVLEVQKVQTKISPLIGGMDILDFGRESSFFQKPSFGLFGLMVSSALIMFVFKGSASFSATRCLVSA
jgi:hypothetical protein